MTPSLETRDLTIRFGGHVAVDHVTCAFRPGELTAIVGPNGAGKTTYFNLISGQLRASDGAVLIEVTTAGLGGWDVLGAYRLEGGGDNPAAYNTLIALRPKGDGVQITALYDKFRLVPFGEYLPMEGLLSPLGFKKMVHIGDGFSPGPRPRPSRNGRSLCAPPWARRHCHRWFPRRG